MARAKLESDMVFEKSDNAFMPPIIRKNVLKSGHGYFFQDRIKSLYTMCSDFCIFCTFCWFAYLFRTNTQKSEHCAVQYRVTGNPVLKKTSITYLNIYFG